MSMRNRLESLNQAILVGIILVGRLGVSLHLCSLAPTSPSPLARRRAPSLTHPAPPRSACVELACRRRALARKGENHWDQGF